MTFGLRCSEPARRPHPASLPVRVPSVESLPSASFSFRLTARPCGSATVAVIGSDWLLSSNEILPMLGTPPFRRLSETERRMTPDGAGLKPAAARIGCPTLQYHSMRMLLTALLATCLLCAQERPIPVILDTDIGDDIDDALALSFALQSPELKLLAVTTVLQNREGRASLVWKILSLFGRTDIPVGAGAEQPLVAPANTGKVRQLDAL